MCGRSVFLAIVLPLLAGCVGENQSAAPVPIKSFLLHGVHAFGGGYVLWAAEDRTAIVQVISLPPADQSGLWEKRYQFKLTAEQWGEVERLVGAHHLLTAKMSERFGVPDEAHPVIVIVAQDRTTTRLFKWAGDKHPDFDPVYEYLLGLCRPEGVPVFEGAYDWEWRPDGFAALRE